MPLKYSAPFSTQGLNALESRKTITLMPYKQTIKVSTFLDLMMSKADYEDTVIPKGISDIFSLPVDFA